MRNVQKQALKALNNKGSAIFEEHEKTGIMQIGKKFNTLSISQYHHYIANYKKYTDFNRLGLYRSILENEKLSTEERIALRDHANETFGKYYHFLQVKDPGTYTRLDNLGREMTKADEQQYRDDLRKAQKKILDKKRLGHRNFGVYSRHNCVSECVMDNLMVKQGGFGSENEIWFDTDTRDKWGLQHKSKVQRFARKNQYRIVAKEHYLDD